MELVVAAIGLEPAHDERLFSILVLMAS